MKKTSYLIILTIIYILTIYKFIAIYLADVAYIESKKALINNNIDKGIFFASKAIKLNPDEPNYYRGRARANLMNLAGKDNLTSKLLKIKIINDLESAYKLNPKNLATIRNSLSLYYFLATKDISSPASNNNVDTDFLPITRTFYQKIKRRYPNDAGVFVSIAKYEKRLCLKEDYEQSIEQIKSLRPDLLKWHESLR